MKKIYHIERDYTKTLQKQKKELEKQYINFEYLFADAANGHGKIHFIADGKKGE